VALRGRIPEEFGEEQTGHVTRMALSSCEQGDAMALLASIGRNGSGHAPLISSLAQMSYVRWPGESSLSLPRTDHPLPSFTSISPASLASAAEDGSSGRVGQP